jgi:hypothetical protein
MDSTTKTYTGFTGETNAFDGYAGLRIGQRYTGTPKDNGTVLVAAIGAPVGTGVTLKAEEWARWFTK